MCCFHNDYIIFHNKSLNFYLMNYNNKKYIPLFNSGNINNVFKTIDLKLIIYIFNIINVVWKRSLSRKSGLTPKTVEARNGCLIIIQ